MKKQRHYFANKGPSSQGYVRVGLWRKLSAKELMLLNCGVGEYSWESFGLQGDQTSQSLRKSILNIHWKNWYWSSNVWATGYKELTYWKRPWCWENWRQEKGTTEDDMFVWHHQLNGHEFDQALGVGRGRGSSVCSSLWGHTELDTAERLNWRQGCIVYCYPAYLTYMQITSCKIPGWMNRE